ncbi:hypothetical protein [Roseivivax isoporae]|uniref:Uncharacterized protein n=1 Tax=Roseivivax isoporae LMG 25204 TaxID=1449351 RepID=X7F8Q1_9RHOB|nr:hypothetical protein [Roseivivax isoporae]ETX28459.1 hypothetical protein RISW2_07045 [Roseivivax isoporae LMG 25204]
MMTKRTFTLLCALLLCLLPIVGASADDRIPGLPAATDLSAR